MPRSVDVTYYWECTSCGMQHIIPTYVTNKHPSSCSFCGGVCVTKCLPTFIAGPVETVRRDRP